MRAQPATPTFHFPWSFSLFVSSVEFFLRIAHFKIKHRVFLVLLTRMAFDSQSVIWSQISLLCVYYFLPYTHRLRLFSKSRHAYTICCSLSTTTYFLLLRKFFKAGMHIMIKINARLASSKATPKLYFSNCVVKQVNYCDWVVFVTPILPKWDITSLCCVFSNL